MFVIKQLKMNNEFENLQSWYLVVKLKKLPEELNLKYYEVEDVQRELDDNLHDENCMCRFKIIQLGTDENPDVFVTPKDIFC